MNATYRCKRSVWLEGLAGIAMGLALVGVFCMTMQEDKNPNAQPYVWILVPIVFGGPILLLCIGGGYTLVVGTRHRLTIIDDHVEWIGAFGTRHVDLGQVEAAIWQSHGSNNHLVLKGPSEKLKIDLSKYTTEEACDLIRFFRLRLRESIQTDWDMYWRRRWRLFDHPDPTQRERFAEETRTLRRRLLALVVGATALALAIMIVVWCYMGDLLPPLSRQLIGLIIAPVMVTPFIFRIRISRGAIADQFASERKKSLLPAFACSFLVLSFMLAVGLAVFDIPGGQLALLIGGIGTVATLFPGAILQGIAVQRANLEAAKAAEDAYMRQ